VLQRYSSLGVHVQQKVKVLEARFLAVRSGNKR